MNGERYEAVVPDTLDLAERGELALHGIAGTVDPADEYMMWFDVYWNNNPPYMGHSGCDVECAPKFLDNFTQLRIMSGSDRYRDIEAGLEASILRYIDPTDGLYYSRYNPNRPWHMGAYKSAGYKTKTQEDYAIPGTTGMALTALIPRNELGLTPCNDLLRTMARGLEREAIHKDDYAYYPEGGSTGHPFTRPRSGRTDTREPMDEHASGEGAVTAYFGYQIRGLAMWAAQTQDQQTLDFAGKLSRFVMKSKFWGHPADPRLVAGRELGHVDSHFHARCIALRGLLEYGIVSGEARVLDFVRGAYDHMRTWGIHEIGFIPTWVNGDRLCMETCFLGDLVALAIKMSDAGLGDYWEDAERVIRNHLAEAQLQNKADLERIVSLTPKKMPEDAFSEHGGQMTDGTGLTMTKNRPPMEETIAASQQICYENVLDRCLGIFAAYLMPTSAYNWRTMQCCTTNAARGLYYAWEGITRSGGEDAEVNLLLNRASPWLDIDSYLPYEGKAVIRNKTCRRICVRIPTWINRGQLRCAVNNTDYMPRFVRNYLVLDPLRPGDAVTLQFPIQEQIIRRTAHAKTPEEAIYQITFRGNTVSDISPRDTNPMMLSLYKRDLFRSGRETPLKTVTRRISPIVARW
jgi:hypothetical protein